ncbi:PilZ domain-containing protein [Shewanella sp. GXUN23E]|uniref:PilZ domain-containing protein n=1 Tax=Shewanella sp. GXUN23E TaxID=3422498 RepID=UPI003D7D1CA0
MGRPSAEDSKHYSSDREQPVSGLSAMDFIDHGSDVCIEFQTPLGQKTQIETQFIGYDNKRHIYYSLPRMPPADMELYLQPQFWAFVTTTSERGEGAIVKFRTQIEFVITQPVSLLVLKLPEQAMLFQLRKEMRYQLNIKVALLMEKRKLEVELRNISANGCGFSYRGIAPVLESGAAYTIEVCCPNTKETFLLQGIIRNHRVHRGRQEYGLLFTGEGGKTGRSLLSKLVFNGAKLVFQKPRPPDNKLANG